MTISKEQRLKNRENKGQAEALRAYSDADKGKFRASQRGGTAAATYSIAHDMAMEDAGQKEYAGKRGHWANEPVAGTGESNRRRFSTGYKNLAPKQESQA